MRQRLFLHVFVGAGLVAAALLPGMAAASQLIDRDARAVTLRVSASGGTALLTYRAHGHVRRVAACRAPDGSYWAVQSWQRLLKPGEAPGSGGAPSELHLSHWRGELAQLSIKVDWAYRRFDHIYGWLSYRGSPVYGFLSTRQGSPLDGYGRNIYLDTYNSAYGGGWRRENGFLTHSRS